MHAYKNQQKYGECVDEFKTALNAINRRHNEFDDNANDDMAASSSSTVDYGETVAPKLPPKSKPFKDDLNFTKQAVMDHAIAQANQNTGTPMSDAQSNYEDNNEDKENISDLPPSTVNADHVRTLDKQISVKEATKKFNRIASEEEASKIISPPAKKKPEKVNENSFFIIIYYLYSMSCCYDLWKPFFFHSTGVIYYDRQTRKKTIIICK